VEGCCGPMLRVMPGLEISVVVSVIVSFLRTRRGTFAARVGAAPTPHLPSPVCFREAIHARSARGCSPDAIAESRGHVLCSLGLSVARKQDVQRCGSTRSFPDASG